MTAICYAYANAVGVKGADRGTLIRRALSFRRVEMLNGVLAQKTDLDTTKPDNTEIIALRANPADPLKSYALIGWMRWKEREPNDMIEHFHGRHLC